MRNNMKKTIVSLTLLALFCVASCESSGTSSLEDNRDGKKYKVVKIGNQVWMAENLNYDASGSKCYDNDPANCEKYGRLYSWNTAMESCPEGWHLPSKEEWQEFIDFAGGIDVAGKKLRAKNFNSGSDNYGFSALPSGALAPDFNGIGFFGFWWSASKTKPNAAYLLNVNTTDRIVMQELDINTGSNIRCLQNKENVAKDIPTKADKEAAAEVPANSFTDTRDNKAYKTVKIGEQTWMAENLNYAAKGSKCHGNKPANCQKYGRLYGWYKKVCPAGWHLPSQKEWDVLINFAGGEKIAGKKLKAKSGWDKNGNGADDYGFSALPGGNYSDDGSFNDVGTRGNWWSATVDDDASIAYLSMDYDTENVYMGGVRMSFPLFSVRCLQD